MKMTLWEGAFWALCVVATQLLAYYVGHSAAHSELLAQCKGPEQGIHLHVGGKRYFYYCAYVP